MDVTVHWNAGADREASAGMKHGQLRKRQRQLVDEPQLGLRLDGSRADIPEGSVVATVPGTRNGTAVPPPTGRAI